MSEPKLNAKIKRKTYSISFGKFEIEKKALIEIESNTAKQYFLDTLENENILVLFTASNVRLIHLLNLSKL